MSSIRLGMAVLAGALLAGCGSTATSQSTTGYQPAAPAPADLAPAAGAGAALSTDAKGTVPVVGSSSPAITIGTLPNAQIERSVTAAYTVPSGSFLNSFEGVIASGVGLGGYVVSSSTQPDSGGRIVSGTVTLKIPAGKIADFLNGMPASFTASSINFSSIDHTAAFVDVNARLASARAHLAALDALLARATSIGDITSLEQQVEEVQAEIDTYQGQLDVLNASVDLSTATVQLSERGAVVAHTPPPGPVGGGIGGGWSNAVQVTGAILEGVISALPLLAVALLGWLMWRRWPRVSAARRRPREPKGVEASA